MSNLIKLIEPQSLECLFSTDSFDEAYAKAMEFEKMGIEVKVVSPSAPESLATLLGAKEEDLEVLKNILTAEIDDHDGSDSCCYTDKRDA